MSLFQYLSSKSFWINVTKVAIPFFIVVVVISLLLSNGGDIVKGNFSEIYTTNFADGKWRAFFSFKILFSILYGLWMTFKNTK